jgi:hypothetical protein
MTRQCVISRSVTKSGSFGSCVWFHAGNKLPETHEWREQLSKQVGKLQRSQEELLNRSAVPWELGSALALVPREELSPELLLGQSCQELEP